MAEMLTRDELDKKIAELQKIRALMLSANYVCLLCLTLYTESSAARRRSVGGGVTCYCDYESDRF